MLKSLYESVRVRNSDLCAEDAAELCGNCVLRRFSEHLKLKTTNKKRKEEVERTLF